MSFIDPRLRQRANAPPARPTTRPDLSNAELLAQFEQATKGNITRETISKYASLLRDAIQYFRTEAGAEIPVREWTKEAVWGYLHHAQNNYCADFHALACISPPQVMCWQNVWIGKKAPEEAAKVCASCPLFRKPPLRHRLNALNRWFSYLASLGYVPVNFVRDIISEHTMSRPKHARTQKGEKKRNPTVEEEVRLVNGTLHPMRRFMWAASAKWWTRPNELFMLDRYASFGEAMPEGLPMPPGFEEAFVKHADLKPFSQGGDMAYIPDTKGPLDKRQGNRWLVIDAELRPIVQAAFEWWDAKVKRDSNGRPRTTLLCLNKVGGPLDPVDVNALLYEDCERLGLMQPGDRKKPLRKWSLYSQRHHGQRRCQELEISTDWNNHFRGDKFRDSRGEYYAPPPQMVRQKYLKLIPPVGFTPLPDVRAAAVNSARPTKGAQA